MPSPDVAAYVGLELVDLDAQQLIDTALTNAAQTFPDWEPREANTEVVILEETAAMAEEVAYVLNQLPDGMAEVLLRLFGLFRDQGAPPSTVVRFNVNSADGFTIPAGTVVRLDLGEDVDPLDLTTVGPLVIAPGSTTGTVAATGATPTLAANGIPAGTRLGIIDTISAVDSVLLDEPVTGGRLAEDGVAFLNRGAATLSTLTTTIVGAPEVAAYVASNPAVARVRVLDLFNPDDDAAPGASPGYVTVAVAGPGGGAVADTVKATIAAELRTKMHAGLSLAVVDADVTAVDVEVTVLRLANADADTVTANVIAALATYLDPAAWPWDNLVRVNEVIARADTAAGVDTVLAVTVPAEDQLLPGYAPLARVGTITVTVEAP
jgi:hypothetical protein